MAAGRLVTEGTVSVLDAEAGREGERWYRLRGTGADGTPTTLGSISIRAFERIVAIELAPVTPNPSSGRALVSFARPVRSFVRLSITDVREYLSGDILLASRPLKAVLDNSEVPTRTSDVA